MGFDCVSNICEGLNFYLRFALIGLGQLSYFCAEKFETIPFNFLAPVLGLPENIVGQFRIWVWQVSLDSYREARSQNRT